MRSFWMPALTAGLLVLAASPAFAQPPGGPGGRGMFQPSAAMLLGNDKVQEELKLTDDQKDALKKLRDKYRDKFQDAQGDRDKMRELFKEAGEAVDKAVPDILKPDQVKRLKQLELQATAQMAGPEVFSKEDVKSALKLSDKQTKEIDEEKDELRKDREDLFKDVGEDREKRTEARKKVQAMQKDAMDKIMASFSDEQKKEWKDLTGEKFEFDFGRGGFRPGGRRPGGDDKPKDNSSK